jgi:S-adenosylmethionine:diacylglycerol 3-amino-3-carboxypropyl transferase
MRAPYTFGISQEDALTELKALNLHSGDRLLCVASGGEVPLNLAALVDDLHVTAVDTTQAQVFLTRLKFRAALELPPLEAARFLGYLPATPSARMALSARLIAMLPPEETAFWKSNKRAVCMGPALAGRYERYIAAFSKLAVMVLGQNNLRKLMNIDSVDGQRAFFDRHMRAGLLRVLFSIAFHPLVYKNRGIDAAALKNQGRVDMPAFFFGRFRNFCTSTPANRNYFLQLTFFGRVLFNEALPEYLTVEGNERLRRNGKNIDIIHSPITVAIAKSDTGFFNRFHLSNIGDWMTAPEHEELFALINEKAAPQSTLVSRYIHCNRPVPGLLRPNFIVEQDRGTGNAASDRYPFYSIVPMRFERKES